MRGRKSSTLCGHVEAEIKARDARAAAFKTAGGREDAGNSERLLEVWSPRS